MMAGIRANSGFSLIELAVVLVIIGLLIGGGITAFVSTVEQTRRSEQEYQFKEIRDALYGFAMANGRLPCPDTDYPPDGAEDCNGNWGALPWVTLGVGRKDSWDNPLRYRVDDNSPDFSDPAADGESPAFDLDDPGSITVEGDVPPGESERRKLVTTAPAVVVSYGPQGDQVWTSTDFVCIAAGVNGFSEDENENCDDNNTFVAAGYRTSDAGDAPANVGEGRFDDMVLWLSTPVLKARMVEAGRLP